MLAIQKLVRNGNSTQLTLLRGVLEFLGWTAGDVVVVEALEDKTVRISRFTRSRSVVAPMLPVSITADGEVKP